MNSPHFLAAVHLRQVRRFEQAEAELRHHLAAEPDDPRAYAELALCLREDQKRLPEALSAIKRAVGLDPDNPTMHEWRCLIHCQMKQGKEALAAANTAVRLDPGSADAWSEKSGLTTSLNAGRPARPRRGRLCPSSRIITWR